MKTSKHVPPLTGEKLKMTPQQYEPLKAALQSSLPKDATFRQSVDLLSQCFFALFPDDMPQHPEIAVILAIELHRRQYPFVPDKKTGLHMLEIEKQLLSVMEEFDK